MTACTRATLSPSLSLTVSTGLILTTILLSLLRDDEPLLFALTGFFPIRAVTLRIGAHARFFVRIAWSPLVSTPGAMKHPYFFLPLIHTSNISLLICVVKYLIKNILLWVLTKTIACDILFIVRVELSEGQQRWMREKKEDCR
jgi:hypothetical protein